MLEVIAASVLIASGLTLLVLCLYIIALSDGMSR